MDIISSQFTLCTEVIKGVLSTLNIQPESYSFLFPPGKDAETIRQLVAEGVFPTIPGLAPAIVYAIIFSALRFFFQYGFLKQFAQACLKITLTPQKKNSEIDGAFPIKNKKKIEDSHIAAFILENKQRKDKLEASFINKYLWVRKRNAMANKKIVKFVEAFWRFLLYSGCCWIGFRTLFVPSTAIWLTDTNKYWENWPDHRITEAMDFYYQVQLGGYLHQLFWTEVSRSDALEMIIHHLTTILLLVFSYITSFTRVGATILLLHDSADILLESAKCFVYISKAKDSQWACKFCDTLFAGFAITFLITRLVLYPRYVIYSVFTEAPNHFGTNWAGFWVFSVLLVILQFLHIFWFYLIARMLWTLLSSGVEKDERSDDEEDIGDEPSSPKNSPKKGKNE